MPTFWIALGLSLLGGLGGLLIASGVLLIHDSARARLIPWLVSYAVGALLGISMMGLLPESLNALPAANVFGTLLGGIMLFFVLEKLVLWRHCHTHDCEVHESSVASVMIGDTFHNFVDGAVIGAAVLTSVPLGVSTAIAVAAHEIPQEIGDFAILLHAGYSRERALVLNVLSALASVAGAIGTFVAFDFDAADSPVLPRDRRVQLPVRGDGRPYSRPPPRTHRRQLPPSNRVDRSRYRDDGLVLLDPGRCEETSTVSASTLPRTDQ